MPEASGKHGHTHAHDHGHTHEAMEVPGSYTLRDKPITRDDWARVSQIRAQAYTGMFPLGH